MSLRLKQTAVILQAAQPGNAWRRLAAHSVATEGVYAVQPGWRAAPIVFKYASVLHLLNTRDTLEPPCHDLHCSFHDHARTPHPSGLFLCSQASCQHMPVCTSNSKPPKQHLKWQFNLCSQMRALMFTDEGSSTDVHR